jgi:hypothetical protein
MGRPSLSFRVECSLFVLRIVAVSALRFRRLLTPAVSLWITVL